MIPNERHPPEDIVEDAANNEVLSETTPLLPGITKLDRDPDTAGSIIESQLPDEDKLSGARLVLRELWVIFMGALPVALAYMLQASLQAVSVLIVGRSSSEDLSTAAFSYMIATGSGYIVGMGGSTALDTLASSSFTGSENKHDLGVLLQRSYLVLTLFYVPVAVLWACSRPVFLALGQTERLATDSALFLTHLIPSGLGYIYFECTKKYLQAQGIMRAGTYVLLITSPITAALNYLFVHVAGWGIFSAPFAAGIGFWLSFFGLVLYAKYVGGSECWGGWSRRSLQNLGTFAKLAFLGFIQVGTEWWAFEIVALAAGRLGELPLASQSVLMTADQAIATIPFGIGVAASARIGNILGARNAVGAARAAYAAGSLSVIAGSIIMTVLLSTRHVFAKIFNDDPQVVELTSEVLPYVALFQIADGLASSGGGTLRSMGRQHIGAIVNLVGYYCIALPVGIYLAFNGQGLAGLWIGQCLALYLVAFGQWAVVISSNWEQQVKRAFERMDSNAADRMVVDEYPDR